MSEKRVLRKRQSQENDHSLFSFDHINPYVSGDKPIGICKTNKKLKEYTYSEDSQIPVVAKRDAKVEKVADSRLESPRKSKLRADPLDDKLYLGFHKSMTKREVSMANHDNLKVLSDMEVLTSQKNMLTQYNWTANIAKITSIKNPRDQDELIKKRDLTIAEINKRLVKFQNWKKRQELLKSEVKFHEHSITKGKVNEYSLLMEELREKRKKERLDAYGGTLKIILNNGYYLMIDPVAPPVIKKDDTFKSPASTDRLERKRRRDTITNLLQNAKIPKVRNNSKAERTKKLKKLLKSIKKQKFDKIKKLKKTRPPK